MEKPPNDSEICNSPSDLSAKESLPFVEVICTASGKIRRFSLGTEAGFAVNLINKAVVKGVSGIPFVSHIEAVKEGEEPVSFGPNSLLVNYGLGWKLQTAIDKEGDLSGDTSLPTKDNKVNDDSDSLKKKPESLSAVSFLYIAKIFLAFIFLFIFGAICTMALENLPQLILYISSSV